MAHRQMQCIKCDSMGSDMGGHSTHGAGSDSVKGVQASRFGG